MDEDDFAKIMEHTGCVRAEHQVIPDQSGNANITIGVYTLVDPRFPGITIRHMSGDAASPSSLEPLVMERDFETAIVFGTQASVRLVPHSQDTRVLSIMLLLRKLSSVKDLARPPNMRNNIHVVGENQEDATSALALGPAEINGEEAKASKSHFSDPDFINTQAIYARAMSQTLAYPIIRNAVSDLFDEHALSPSVDIMPAYAYVVVGEEFTFGVVRASCLQETGHKTIAIRFIASDMNNKVHMCPPHADKRKWLKNDKIITLRRSLA